MEIKEAVSKEMTDIVAVEIMVYVYCKTRDEKTNWLGRWNNVQIFGFAALRLAGRALRLHLPIQAGLYRPASLQLQVV